MLIHTVSPSRVYFYVFPVCISDTAGLCTFACVLSFFDTAVCIFCLFLRVPCLHFRHCRTLHVCCVLSFFYNVCIFLSIPTCPLSAFQTLLDFARLLVCSPFSILLCLFLSIPTFPVSALQTLLDFARLLVCAPQIYRFSLTCIFLCVPCLHFRHCWTLRVCLCALLFLCCVYIFIFSYVSRVCTSILLGFARMLVCLLFRHCWTSMSSLQTLLGFARLLV